MKITKKGEKTTYQNISKKIWLDVDGKEVNILYSFVDSEYGDNDCDLEIDEKSGDPLTEEEEEELTDYLWEAISLKDKQKLDTKQKVEQNKNKQNN
jgi:hypothetical protein